jgi:hypothetical protein
MDAGLPQDVTTTVVMMIAEEVADTVEEDAMIIVDTAEMTVTVATAEIVTITLHVGSIATLVMTGIAAVEAMTDVEVAADTLTVMTEATVELVRRLQPPPMVIQHLVGKVGNHTEVDASMMREHPIAIIDC